MKMPHDPTAWRAAYRARIDALERVRAQELAALTDERARQILESLEVAEPPEGKPPECHGLVEQQAIFMRWWTKQGPTLR